MKPFIINVKNVSKVYVEKPSGIQTKALENISFDVEEGDFVALTGPAGSGKTTLLNILSALEPATSGEVVVAQIPLAPWDPGRAAGFRLKHTSFIFPSHNLIDALTVFENTEYVALLQGISKKIREHDAISVLKDLGLEKFAGKRPAALDIGQQQRVAVARAILTRPKIVLADDPAARLDPKTGSELIDLMKAIGQNLNIAFIFATRDEKTAQKAKTTINLRDGKIVSL